MIYLVGAAPRTGKNVISQEVSAKLQIGWISTDLLYEVLRIKQVEGVKTHPAEIRVVSLRAVVYRITDQQRTSSRNLIPGQV